MVPACQELSQLRGGGPRKLSFSYTSSQGHVSCPPLLDCGQKTSAPGHPVAQGLKKRHRDSEGRAPALCRDTSQLLSFLPLPFFTQGPRPRFILSEAPQVLFVVLAQVWGRQAKTWPTEGQLHVNKSCPHLRSDLLILMLHQPGCFTFPDHSSPSHTLTSPLAPCKSSLVLVVCSEHPFPSVAGNLEERERCCHISYSSGHGFPLFPLLVSWVPMDSGIWLRFLCIYIYTHIYLNTHIYIVQNKNVLDRKSVV